MGISEEMAHQLADQYRAIGVEHEWILKECPSLTVTVNEFCLSKYPITNSQFKAFLKGSGYGVIPTSWHLGIYPANRANHPVYGVTFNDINHYLTWLNELTGLNYRLPTEAEWEYAAKGNTEHQFPWGNSFDSDCANTLETGIFNTTPVGLFPKGQSPFGIMDMSGNVEEYLADNATRYCQDAVHSIDNIEFRRITRGGSFSRTAALARTTSRHSNFPKLYEDTFVMGFRVAS